MHSLDQNSSTIPAFIIKLWKLVEDDDCDDLISWGEKGDSFILRHQAIFARDLLPKYFKHSNMASFIRQLNMYGFRKVMNYGKGGLNVDNDEMEFYHPYFMKKSENLLQLIKRKVNMPTKVSEINSHPKDIFSDLSIIHEKQASMDSMLIGMKKENELLWRELSSLRQKHKTQEQIIQKVIHFLVTIVQSSKQNIGVKRKITHMLQDSTATSTKRSRGLIDLMRGKKADFFFSQVSDDDDKATSPEGPVIHEVTDYDHEDSMDIERSLPSGNKSSHRQTETVAQIQSPLSCSTNVASPADSFDLLEPNSSRTSILPYEKAEEVLGLPMDLPSTNISSVADNIGNAISTTNDISNVISFPDIEDKSPFFDLLISSPDGNIISMQEMSKMITAAPENDGNISVTNKSDFKNQPVVLSNDIPFSPSRVTVINDGVGASNQSSTIKYPEVTSMKFLDQERSMLKTEGKPKSCMKLSQNSSKKDVILGKKIENQENTMQNNFQLTLSDANSSAEIAKNTITNHILDVDQEIDWLQGQLNSGGFDSSMLLEIFSSDESANNAVQSQLHSDVGVLRDSDSNIIGNELVQFTPSILDICFDDMENPILTDYLNESKDTSLDDMNTNLAGIVKPQIKQERKESTSCYAFENSADRNQNSPSKVRKLSRGRGKRKPK